MKDDRVVLSQILERIERIEHSGITRERFLGSPWDQDAVIRNLEIVGEAAKRLSESVRKESRAVPWGEIAGFRDVAIHAYDRLDLERTWQFVEHELPRLKREIRTLLRRLGHR